MQFICDFISSAVQMYCGYLYYDVIYYIKCILKDSVSLEYPNNEKRVENKTHSGVF